MKLKTLHINTEKTWRGGEQQTLYLLRGLVELGHGVTLVAQPGSPMARRGREDGVRVVEMAMRSEGDLPAVWRLASLMKRETFDIVHSHTGHAHTLAWFAAYFGGRPRRIVSRRVDFSIYKHRLSTSLLKYSLGADLYICVSEAVRRVLIADGVDPRRLHVAYSCIDGSRFDENDGLALRREFGITNGSPVIGNVGHMVDHKGQEYLVDAMPRVLRSVPDARFFIVGEGKLKKKLEARAEALGVAGSLYTPGFRPDVPDFMGMFDVFVMPSKMEGLGTSVLDALAAGKPVVATRTGGIPEMIQHGRNGILVQPCNPDDLARGILRVLKSPSEAAKLARVGREMARDKFSVQNLVRDTLEIYRYAMRTRSAGRRKNGP